MNFRQIIAKYKWQFLLTLFLILLDAGLLILFPLFIGYSIDDAMIKEYRGAILLGTLGLSTLLIGAGRRWFDSRFYAKVYEDLGVDVGRQSNSTNSTKTARLGFLGEVVEFFENSLPEIINNSIGLIGTLAIVAAIDVRVFTGCMVILLLVAIVYGLTEKKTLRFNSSFNNELEQRADILASNRPNLLKEHLSKLMKWNIRLSDLETINFSIIWLLMMIFLVISIVAVASDGIMQYGSLFALILYLFQFIESVTVMPFFYQQWLRLTEITGRLKEI